MTNAGWFKPGQHWRPWKPFQEKDYLLREYAEKGRSAAEIADEHGCTEGAILFWLHKHSIRRRTIAEARILKAWGAVGVNNPMFGKRGDLAPSWKGGLTPERQRVYSTPEWQTACEVVLARDGYGCRRCGRQPQGKWAFVFHHILPFRFRRGQTDPSNLVILCQKCHGFVHSKANVNREFIATEGGD